MAEEENINEAFSFDEINVHGTENQQVAIDLQTLNEARNYRRMLYSHIQDALGERIIEIGSGIGNYTEMLLEHGHVWATDIEDQYVQFLSKRFAGRKDFKASLLRLGALTADDYREILNFSPDTFVCMNVLEHIQDDIFAMNEMVSCLTVGGHAAVIVPALPWLYCSLDRKYGHFRRYTKDSVKELVSHIKNAQLVHCQYFNFIGVLGWWFNNVLLNREALPQKQTYIYDKFLVPWIDKSEKLYAPPFGLSIVFWVRRMA